MLLHHKQAIQRLLGYIHQAEDCLLVSALVVMLGMAVLQILLRNFFDTGLLWAESFLRILVLWITMLGAMVATQQADHINIDIISKISPPSKQPMLTFFVNSFSALICGLVAYHAAEFIQGEYQDKTVAFIVACIAIPTWVCQAIIPLGFAVMALRFAHHGVKAVVRGQP